MGYRIMEVISRAPDSLDGATPIGEFDSAYQAVEQMKRAFVERGDRAPPWYLIDPYDQILFGPDDLYDAVA